MRTHHRAGFTLIELLVTLAIMALVMTALLADAAGHGQGARRGRGRHARACATARASST
jgi:prepilin-type N-terminal cleavage/methylation domain-containing protein